MYHFPRRGLDFIARILLATAFIVVIPSKITSYNIFLTSIVDKGISPSYADVLLLSAIFCLIAGSMFILFGNQRLGSFLLLIFLIPTTFVFHASPFQARPFFMNVSLAGGLLLLYTRPYVYSKKTTTINLDKLISHVFSSIKQLFK